MAKSKQIRVSDVFASELKRMADSVKIILNDSGNKIDKIALMDVTRVLGIKYRKREGGITKADIFKYQKYFFNGRKRRKDLNFI